MLRHCSKRFVLQGCGQFRHAQTCEACNQILLFDGIRDYQKGRAWRSMRRPATPAFMLRAESVTRPSSRRIAGGSVRAELCRKPFYKKVQVTRRAGKSWTTLSRMCGESASDGTAPGTTTRRARLPCASWRLPRTTRRRSITRAVSFRIQARGLPGEVGRAPGVEQLKWIVANHKPGDTFKLDELMKQQLKDNIDKLRV
jgi:hypothetical protein